MAPTSTKSLPVIQPEPASPAPAPGRRQFLANVMRLSGGALVFIAGGTIADALAAVAEKPRGEAYSWDEHLFAYLIDTSKCIGCGSCVRACAAENDVPDGFYRTWVERYVLSAEGSHVDSPNGGKDGFAPIEPGFHATKSFFVPKMCNHCADSPCTQVCPVGATFETKDGVVLIDKDYCLGCRYCVQACPYGCRYIDPRTNTADKCTLCYHRLTRGLQPACCEACPTGARQIAVLKNPHDPVHEFLRTHKIQILKPQMATGAKVYYNGLDGSVR